MGSPVGVVKQTGTAGASNIAINLYNVSTDQLGAPRIITRQLDEAIVWRWDSAEAFGATTPDQNPATLGTFSFNQRLPGQVFDAESGLFQNWYRDYNPRIGRYMQSDPIGLVGGVNTFGYVDGNPLSAADPLGLFEVEGYPSAIFDKRKYPKKVQDLYKYAGYLEKLLKKNCPGNSKAQELFATWVAKISPRWADPITNYKERTTEFTAPFFDEKVYGPGKPGPAFVFMHEFMHLTDSNYAKSRGTSIGEYINAFTKGISNDLPFEKDADQLVRDLMNGKCPCD